MVKDFKAQEKRIKKVFPENFKDIFMNTDTIKIYKDFLENNLTFPIKVTGIEDFDWEEYYVLGPGDEDEYEELKKTRASYTDTFNIIGIDKYYDCSYGLFAKVIRVSDKKRFQLPLAELEAIDKKSKNYQLLYDYAVWFVNY